MTPCSFDVFIYAVDDNNNLREYYSFYYSVVQIDRSHDNPIVMPAMLCG